jgi:replicative DNA helicase
MTCGFQGGDLIIIAGRPSMGKTALALNISENAARSGNKILFFSLEMAKELLLNRLLSSMAGVDANRFRNGRFQEEDFSKITNAAGNIHSLPLIIDDRSDITVMDIRATARQAQRKGNLSLVVIDYLQLMRPVTRYQSREQEVAEISKSLKALAKELRVPIIVLAQLNRDCESNGVPRRPLPRDLRESGSLEQDADLILFPWREAVYCEECKKKGRDCGKGHFRRAEINIGKQRNGPTGTIKADWFGEFGRFEPATHDHF